MNLSIVIPLLNEEESLQELHDWIVSVMQAHHYSYEVLFIDDGSTDDSWKIIEKLSAENPNIKGIHFHTNYGKSQALHAGFARAKGDVVITMDEFQHHNDAEKYAELQAGFSRRYSRVLFHNLFDLEN